VTAAFAKIPTASDIESIILATTDFSLSSTTVLLLGLNLRHFALARDNRRDKIMGHVARDCAAWIEEFDGIAVLTASGIGGRTALVRQLADSWLMATAPSPMTSSRIRTAQDSFFARAATRPPEQNRNAPAAISESPRGILGSPATDPSERSANRFGKQEGCCGKHSATEWEKRPFYKAFLILSPKREGSEKALPRSTSALRARETGRHPHPPRATTKLPV
jgi:hypothetical protein